MKLTAITAALGLALPLSAALGAELPCPWPDGPEAEPEVVDLGYDDPPAQFQALNCYCTDDQPALVQQMVALRSDPMLGNDGRLKAFLSGFGGDPSLAAAFLVNKYIRNGIFGNRNSVLFSLDPPKSKSTTTRVQRTLYCIPEYDVNLYEADLANWMAFHPALAED